MKIEIITENGRQFAKVPLEELNQLVSEKAPSLEISDDEIVEEKYQKADVKTLLRAFALLVASVLYTGSGNLLLALSLYGVYWLIEGWFLRIFGEQLEAIHKMYWWVMLSVVICVFIVVRRALW